MWKSISIFTSCLLISLEVLAGNGDLEIVLVNKNRIELNPGSASNFVIMLINNSGESREFLLKMNTPDGWSQISDYASVVVEKSSKKIKIFSVYILESTRVGDYNIEIEAFESSGNTKIGEVQVPFHVKPRYDVIVKSLKAPDYLLSGDTMTVSFMIQNLSNVEAKIEASIINASSPETRIYALAPDSIAFVSVFISTAKEIIQYSRLIVSLTATVIPSLETKSTAMYFINVIPSSKIKFDPYERIPVKISGLLVTDNKDGERKYGYMLDVIGAGLISKSHNRAVDFHFRGPDQQGNPIIGQTDEYYVKYSSPHSKAVLGDNSYHLTDLTEGSRNGRGIEYEHTLKKLSFGSFINYPRFYPNITRVSSVFGSYFEPKKHRISLGFLNKTFANDSIANLFSISGEAVPFSWANIEAEFASGMSGGKTTLAYSTAIKANFRRLRLFFNFQKADEDFPGYISNSLYVSSGINTAILRKFNLSLNYNVSHLNVAIDTLYANAPFSDNMNVTVNYMLKNNFGASLGMDIRSKEDMRIPKQFNYKEYTARLTLQCKIKRIAISTYGAKGKTKNLLQLKEGEVTDIMDANFSLQYKISKAIYFKGFVSYHSGQQYLTTDYTSLFYGGTINALWNNKLKFLIQYQNNYEVEEYYRDRSLLALDANFTINPNHDIGILVNYNLQKNELNQKQLSANLTYTYTFGVPVSKKDDVGSLNGKVISKGVETVEGILFSLAGNIAITDKNGEFEFPFVKAGTHFLFMDNSKSGLNSIAETPGPYQVEIIPGENYIFTVSITKSAKITGNIVVVEDENKDKKGFIAAKEELSKLIVEVNNGTETFRIFTRSDGSFTFGDLRPGAWKVFVYDKGLPKGYKLINNEFNIILDSGKTENVEVIIKKESRKIQFQKKQ